MAEPKATIGKTIADSTPAWPTRVAPPTGAPNILVVLFDDVGFSDFGCYGSPIATPTIDALAAHGLRYTGFHTTAMCSTTRAALLTGRNHHSVGVGCLANFDSGYPGYRGKIAPEAGTLAEMLRPAGYRNYMVGKWHVTSLTETGPKWELYHLDEDFSETEDLAAQHPERLATLIALWWAEAERCKVLPLDDRFGPRFAENAARVHGSRKRYVFHAGMGHLPTDVAPDVRARSFVIEADIRVEAGSEGVLIAHGDATCGYALFVRDGRLIYDVNVGGRHAVVTSDRTIPTGHRRLGVAVRSEPGRRVITLFIDRRAVGSGDTVLGFQNFVSWSGLDIGQDRGSPVADYSAPFEFTGVLKKVTVTMDADQRLDGEAIGDAEMARQ